MRQFIINEHQERVLLEFTQFGFSLGKLDTLNFNEKIKYCREFLGSEIGNGMSRIVFELDDERVLKLAINSSQIFQNKNEVLASKYIGKKFPQLFPKVFLKADDYSWIVTERVLPFKHEDCIAILGIPYSSSFSQYAKDYNSTVKDYSEYMKSNQIGVEIDYDTDESVDISFMGFIDWCERISNDMETREDEDEEYYKLIKEIPELEPFYHYINGVDGVTDVFDNNLGLAMRNGKPTIIILDNGYETFK